MKFVFSHFILFLFLYFFLRNAHTQVLELTDALAVNSTAVRLEWHLLSSNTEYYIEVIQWNNLIEFYIRTTED